MEKGLIYISLSVGMAIGGYLPVLFGASAFSIWSILGSTAGGIAAIVFIYKVNR